MSARGLLGWLLAASLLCGARSAVRIEPHPRAITPPDVAVGRAVFVRSCAPCHREDGGGAVGPNLTDSYWIHGGRPEEIHRTVRDGVAAKGMPAWGRVLSPYKLSSTVAYVTSLRGTDPRKPKGPQGANADSARAAVASPGSRPRA